MFNEDNKHNNDNNNKNKYDQNTVKKALIFEGKVHNSNLANPLNAVNKQSSKISGSKTNLKHNGSFSDSKEKSLIKNNIIKETGSKNLTQKIIFQKKLGNDLGVISDRIHKDNTYYKQSAVLQETLPSINSNKSKKTIIQLLRDEKIRNINEITDNFFRRKGGNRSINYLSRVSQLKQLNEISHNFVKSRNFNVKLTSFDNPKMTVQDNYFTESKTGCKRIIKSKNIKHNIRFMPGPGEFGYYNHPQIYLLNGIAAKHNWSKFKKSTSRLLKFKVKNLSFGGQNNSEDQCESEQNKYELYQYMRNKSKNIYNSCKHNNIFTFKQSKYNIT